MNIAHTVVNFQIFSIPHSAGITQRGTRVRVQRIKENLKVDVGGGEWSKTIKVLS